MMHRIHLKDGNTEKSFCGVAVNLTQDVKRTDCQKCIQSHNMRVIRNCCDGHQKDRLICKECLAKLI